MVHLWLEEIIMNDFTKDELEFIALSIDSITLEDNEMELHDNLFHKLQSMIDNFDNHCKHMLTMTDTFTKCAHCNVVLGY